MPYQSSRRSRRAYENIRAYAEMPYIPTNPQTQREVDALYWQAMDEATRPAPARPNTATDDPDLDEMPF
jgi:hypothetical protein